MILDINYATFSCGGISEFPVPVANLIAMLINIVKIVVPIVLIVMGMLDLTKAVMAQKEDEMKKAQTTFVKRLISGVLVFFVVAIVQFAFGTLGNASGENSYMDCISCFVNGVNEGGECK